MGVIGYSEALKLVEDTPQNVEASPYAPVSKNKNVLSYDEVLENKYNNRKNVPLRNMTFSNMNDTVRGYQSKVSRNMDLWDIPAVLAEGAAGSAVQASLGFFGNELVRQGNIRRQSETGVLLEEMNFGGIGQPLALSTQAAKFKRMPDPEIIRKGRMLLEKQKQFFINHPSLTREHRGAAERFVYDLGGGAFNLLTAVGITALTKSPTFASAYFGAMARADTFVNLLDSDVDVDTTQQLSELNFLTEFGLEFAGLDMFFGAKKIQSVLLRNIVRAMSEGVQEFSQSLSTGAIQKLGVDLFAEGEFPDFKVSKPWGQVVAESLYEGAIGTLLGGGTGVAMSHIETRSAINSLVEQDVPRPLARQIVKRMERNADISFHEALNEFLDEQVGVIPEFKSTEDALKFGRENASDPTIRKQLEVKRQAVLDQIGRLDKGQLQEKLDLGFKSQFLREAIEQIDSINTRNIDKEKQIKDSVDNILNEQKKQKQTEEAQGAVPIITEKVIRNQKLDQDEAEVLSRPENKPLADIVNDLQSTRELLNSNPDPRNIPALEGKISALEQKLGKAEGKIKSAPSVNKLMGVEKENKIYTERQSLKRSLQRQVTVARQAAQSTRKQVKLNLKRLVKLINSLPKSLRGNFTNDLKNLSTNMTAAKYERVARKAYLIFDKYQREQSVSQIQKRLRRLTKFKSISVDFQQQLFEFFGDFDLQTKHKGFLASLKKTQEWIDSEAARGRDMGGMQMLVDELRVFEHVNAATELTVPQLQNVFTFLQLMEFLGRAEFRSRKLIAEAKKAIIVDAIDKQTDMRKLESIDPNTKPVPDSVVEGTTKPELRTEPGEKVSPSDLWYRWKMKARNMAIDRGLIGLTPPEILMDILDGGKNYGGAISTHIKQPLMVRFQNYLANVHKIKNDLFRKIDELKLHSQNFQRMGVILAADQEGGVEKLNSTGVSQEMIDDIRDTLTPQETELINYMRDILVTYRPALAQTLLKVYNKTFTAIQNYFPFMTDFEALNNLPIHERIGDLIPQFNDKNFNRKNVKKDFLEERVEGARQPIQIDAVEVFLHHISNAEYFLNMAEQLKLTGEVVLSKSFKNKVGDLGAKFLADWVDTMARRGKMANETWGLMDYFRRNTGMAILFFRVSSAVIQTTAWFDGAARIGGDYAMRGAQAMADPNWREFVIRNMPELAARFGDDITLREFMDVPHTSKSLNRLGEAGSFALRKLDAITATAIAVGGYIKAVEAKGGLVDLNNPDPQALQQAQLDVRRSQSSGLFPYVPQALTRGKLTGSKSADRAILQFQSFLLNRFSVVAYDMYTLGFKSGNVKQGVNIATWLAIATVAEMGLRRLTKETLSAFWSAVLGRDIDFVSVREREGAWTSELARNFIGNIPVAGSLIMSAEYGSMPVPSLDLIRRTFDHVARLRKTKEEEARFRQGTKLLADFMGAAFGMPSSAFNSMVNAVSRGESKRKRKRKKKSFTILE